MGGRCFDSVAYLGSTWIPSSNLCRVGERMTVIFISLTTEGCIKIVLFHVFCCRIQCTPLWKQWNSFKQYLWFPAFPHVHFILMLQTTSTSKSSSCLVQGSLLCSSKVSKRTRQENTVHLEVSCKALRYPAWYCRDVLNCMCSSPCKTITAHGQCLLIFRICTNLWSGEWLSSLLGALGGRVKVAGWRRSSGIPVWSPVPL